MGHAGSRSTAFYKLQVELRPQNFSYALLADKGLPYRYTDMIGTALNIIVEFFDCRVEQCLSH